MLYEETILKPIEEYLISTKPDIHDKCLKFRRCINERWFTNTLAWLLNPKGSHGFGVSFGKEFVQTIAQIRSTNESKYKRGNSLLKWGKEGHGTPSTTFSFKNASVACEFYLAEDAKGVQEKSPRYCDIALIDLDSKDSLILVIENKLFSSNERNQLQGYHKAVEKRFKKAKTREYVYLTIDGSDPKVYDGDHPQDYKYWVRMSWIEHIFDILETLSCERKHNDIVLLEAFLVWFGTISARLIPEYLGEYKLLSTAAVRDCLKEELNRLCAKGKWETDLSRNNTLIHTSYPKRNLVIDLQSIDTITMQSHLSGKPLYQKIVLPNCINPNQLYKMLDIEARRIYSLHFNNPKKFLAKNKKSTKKKGPMKRKYRKVFNLAHNYHHELQVLMALSNRS